MTLDIHYPQPPLADYVQMMWQWENYTSPAPKERILPIGVMEMTFDLSTDGFTIEDRAIASEVAMVVGCQSDYFVIDTSRPVTLFSVLFRQGVALDIFGLSAKELHNQIVPLSDIWGTDADHIYNQLMQADTSNERFSLIENMLLNRLNLYRERHYAVDYALSTLAVNAQQSIRELQKDIALSPPRFIQVFRDEIGFTPKVYTRLQRFHRVLDMISASQPVDWADLALQLGYYDQSHLINEFRKFSGISPSAYAPFSPAHNKNIPYHEKS